MPYKNKEDEKEYRKKYRDKNKEKLKIQAHEYYILNKDEINIIHKQYRLTHKEEQIIYNKSRKEENRKYLRERRQRLKIEVFTLLGNQCKNCGCIDLRILQIDHIIPIRRNRRTWSEYSLILKEIKSGTHNYQLLCPNCNWLKRMENHEYR